MRFSFAAANSASAASQLQYRHLVTIGTTSGSMYVCNGNQFLYTLGNTYSPVGGLGGIEPIEDESDVQPRTVRMWLRAVGSADLAEPLREDMFNRPVLIDHGYLSNSVDVTFVSTPERLWKGFINNVDIHFADAEKGNFFEIEAESSLRRSAEVVNFTKEAHQTVMGQSGDTFFAYIHQVPMIKALWGNQSTTFNGAAPGHWTSPHPGRVRGTWVPGG